MWRVSDESSTAPKDGEGPGSDGYKASVERTRDAQFGDEETGVSAGLPEVVPPVEAGGDSQEADAGRTRRKTTS